MLPTASGLLPTASGLTRALRCPASLQLPQVQREAGAPAVTGTQVHRFLETVSELGREAALEAVTDERAARICAALDLSTLPLGDGTSWASEVAFGWHMASGAGREVGRNVGRGYPTKPGELYGTADLVALSADSTTVHVLDVKTGRGWMPSAAESAQLRFLAMAACATYGCCQAEVGHLHVREDGTVWLEKASLDALELDLFAVQLRTLQATVQAREGRLAEGPWCRYCPAFASCPAKVALACASVDAPAQLTPETAAAAWLRMKEVRQVLDRVEEVLREYATNTPIPLGNGLQVVAAESSRDELDGAKVYAVMARLYGAEVAQASVDLEASKRSLDRAVRMVAEAARARGEKVTLKALSAETLEAVRQAGGLTTRTRVDVRERREVES
jgi:hypothetical protein